MRSSPSNHKAPAADPLAPGPRGFAHRGLHDGGSFPENSLTAFAAALELGAGIECDLRLTADNVVVVFHDSDGSRICGSPLRIGRSSHAELERLRVGVGPIPTLDSLLALVGGRVPLLLELKVEDDLWRWAPALIRALGGYAGPFGVMSFDPRVIRIVKSHLPRFRRGLVIKDRTSAWKRFWAMALADPQFIAVEMAALGKTWVEKARTRMPVYTWTVRTPEVRRQAEVHADAAIWEDHGRP